MKISDIWIVTKTRKSKEIKKTAILKAKECYGVKIAPKYINTLFKHEDLWYHQVWFPTIEVNQKN